MGSIRIAELWIYPGKSMIGQSVDSMQFDAFGPQDDRRFMVVDHKGNMVTQRTQPRLALVRPVLMSDGLMLHAPGKRLSIFVHPSTDQQGEVKVRVHRDICRGLDLGDDVAWWLGSFLGIDCRLVWMPPDHDRVVDPRFTGTLKRVGYADGFPLMAMNNASIANFNTRLEAGSIPPVTMPHFRPNLILSGLEPYAEDDLYHLNFSVVGPRGRRRGVVLRFAKLNARCVTINVRSDGQTVETDSRILRTLAKYRTKTEPTSQSRGVMLGVNLLVYTTHAEATISVGDRLVRP